MSINFSRCKVLADELLVKQDLTNRFLNMKKLKYDKEIWIDSLQNYSEITGVDLSRFMDEKGSLKDSCLIMYDGIYLILYNADMHYMRINWSIAHEAGHVYLEHTNDGPDEEIEANAFAAELLMPQYALWQIDRRHGLEEKAIAEIFCVSPQSAKKRIETMGKLKYRQPHGADAYIWNSIQERVELYYETPNDRLWYETLVQYLSIKDYLEGGLEHAMSEMSK